MMNPQYSVHSQPLSNWAYAAAASGIVNTTTAVTIKAAEVGMRCFITSIQISAEALGTATEVVIRNGAGGTVIWRTKIGTGGITAGQPIVLSTPINGSTNTLLEVATLTASVTGAVYVNVQGYCAV